MNVGDYVEANFYMTINRVAENGCYDKVPVGSVGRVAFIEDGSVRIRFGNGDDGLTKWRPPSNFRLLSPLEVLARVAAGKVPE